MAGAKLSGSDRHESRDQEIVRRLLSWFGDYGRQLSLAVQRHGAVAGARG